MAPEENDPDKPKTFPDHHLTTSNHFRLELGDFTVL